MKLELSDPRLTVTVDKFPRSRVLHVDTIAGKCFDDGTHGRVIEYYSWDRDSIKQMRKQMADLIAQDVIIDCDNPDCDICHPLED